MSKYTEEQLQLKRENIRKKRAEAADKHKKECIRKRKLKEARAQLPKDNQLPRKRCRTRRTTLASESEESFANCGRNIPRLRSFSAIQVEPLSSFKTEENIEELDEQTNNQNEKDDCNDNEVANIEQQNISLDNMIASPSDLGNDEFSLIASNICKVRKVNDRNINSKFAAYKLQAKRKQQQLRREISKLNKTIKIKDKTINKWKNRYWRLAKKNSSKDSLLKNVKKIESKGKKIVRERLIYCEALELQKKKKNEKLKGKTSVRSSNCW